MNERPTLAELRARAQKGRHTEIGNVLARRFARPAAIFGTWIAVRLGLSANQVTLMSLAANLAGAAAIGFGSPMSFVVGVILLHLGFWLDHVDGQVARWRGTASLSGVYFDYLLHHASGLALGFALGFGLSVKTAALAWTAVGFAIATGWTLLSLHNETRYKAYFQRLKSTDQVYRVRGGAGGAPAPPAPMPALGWARWSWLAAKVCEWHVVLLTLSALAILAIAWPTAWRYATMAYVAGMAILAPLLAAARILRAVHRRTIDSGFDAWFAPLDAGPADPQIGD